MAGALQLIIACAGIFGSFSYFAVLQEDVYKTDYDGEKFQFTFLALLVERGINALVAAVGVAAFGGSGLKIPYMDISLSGMSQMFAMAGSNEALRYVSYPTQVLGKSCKMVPVMAGGLLLGGKSYTLFEYLQVALITGGVVVFNFGGKKKGGDAADSAYGLVLIALSLIMDMVTGGLQDKVKKSTKELNPSAKSAKPTMNESMLYTNLSGALIAGALAVATGHLSDGIAFCNRHPGVLNAILIYSLASAVGQLFVYFTVTEFGPLLLTTVTTTRKIFSTLFSVFRNPNNSLSEMQWGGCCLVFAGLLLDVAAKLFPAKKTPPKKETEMSTVKGEGKAKRTSKAD
eukprot:CAMPEP_0118817308 /NCGR_PEP_ID=MMETSP1162-20130426/5338_1 /TAXON_ID=33656 /ORGANISM="Phaeocystis Sp, Strain CCMP2710" /LENGTH=343 /DNA_ID=CAMNT_0006747401 /DNA_START=3 /DNA_END=1034 /DNA_ORIENTATION=+